MTYSQAFHPDEQGSSSRVFPFAHCCGHGLQIRAIGFVGTELSYGEFSEDALTDIKPSND